MIIAKKRKWYWLAATSLMVTAAVSITAVIAYQTNLNQATVLRSDLNISTNEVTLDPSNGVNQTSPGDNGLTDKNLNLPVAPTNPAPIRPVLRPDQPMVGPDINIADNNLNSLVSSLEGQLIDPNNVPIPPDRAIDVPKANPTQLSEQEKQGYRMFVNQFVSLAGNLSANKDALKKLFMVKPDEEPNFEAWFNTITTTSYAGSKLSDILRQQLQVAQQSLERFLAMGMIPTFNWKNHQTTAVVWDFADINDNVVRNRFIADNKRRVLSNSSE